MRARYGKRKDITLDYRLCVRNWHASKRSWRLASMSHMKIRQSGITAYEKKWQHLWGVYEHGASPSGPAPCIMGRRERGKSTPHSLSNACRSSVVLLHRNNGAVELSRRQTVKPSNQDGTPLRGNAVEMKAESGPHSTNNSRTIENYINSKMKAKMRPTHAITRWCAACAWLNANTSRQCN